MNEQALKLFNETAKLIRDLEAEISKSKNLREVRGSKYDERKRKIAAKYEAAKQAALTKICEERFKKLHDLNEAIMGLQERITLSQKRLTELAQEVGKPPRESQFVQTNG